MRYAVGGRAIFDGLNLTARRGRITAFMGPSGHRQDDAAAPHHRPGPTPSAAASGCSAMKCRRMSGKELFALRQRMGMLFQNGALLTDEDVYENVAFPGARAYQASRIADPAARADQAACGGPARRRAADAGGAVGRHAAARGAGARHRHGSGHPDLRRALRRSRSDLDGRHLPPHQADERSAGHHQHRGLARRAGALDRSRTTASCCRRARSSRRARPRSCIAARWKRCGSSWAALPDGPVPFHYPAPDYFQQLLEEAS